VLPNDSTSMSAFPTNSRTIASPLVGRLLLLFLFLHPQIVTTPSLKHKNGRQLISVSVIRPVMLSREYSHSALTVWTFVRATWDVLEGRMSIESYQSSQYTYHMTFDWKHMISSIILVLRAAANPFYPDSFQLLLVLSLPSKAPLLYLHHILFFVSSVWICSWLICFFEIWVVLPTAGQACHSVYMICPSIDRHVKPAP
jgi:hypothetical protein